jgi:hypothetical protein
LKKLNGRVSLENLDADRNIKIIAMLKEEDGRALV